MTANLKSKTISAIAWNALGNVFRQAAHLTTLIVLAKYLSPGEFGLFSIAMVFVVFMQILNDMGLANAVIFLDSPKQRMLSSIFYFNIVIGSALSLLLYLMAEPLALFFDEPDLKNLLQVISVSFIIAAVSLVPKALSEKRLFFRRIMAVEVVSWGLGAGSAIAVAVFGGGIYSLAALSLVTAVSSAFLFWVFAGWRPSVVFSFQDIKDVWRYTANLTGFNMINYFARNADNFLVGKFIGSSALGLYSIAYNIMLYPLQNISRVIVRVLFPAFSVVKNDNPRLKGAYLKAISFIAMVTFPLMMGLLATAESFVGVVFGDKWEGLAILLMILAPIGMIQSIVTTVGSIFTAKGTTGKMFKLGAANSFVIVLAFVLGLPFGVTGVAFSYFVANVIMLYPNLKFSWDQLELSVVEGLGRTLPYLLSSMAMAGLVKLLEGSSLVLGLNAYLQLLLLVGGGVVSYLSILIIFFRRPFLLLLGELKSLKARGSSFGQVQDC